jgi:2-dehydro-3-deoxygluconokinase
VVTFGEVMVRLAPPQFHRLEQASLLEMRAGGAEANVAVALARLGAQPQGLGARVRYVTRLPRNPLGRFLEDQIRLHGVDTSLILWTDADRVPGREGWAPAERVGLYFVEFGASPRASAVYYDRRDSAMSRLKPGDIDWPKVFAGARHFHTSGITPALSPSCREATAEALAAAKEAGLTVSIDLNYRGKLWSPAEARATMTQLLRHTDFLVTSESDAREVLGITAGDVRELAHTLMEAFGLKAVAITTGAFISQWRSRLTAVMLAEGEFHETRTYDLEIVDRLGTGDSCTAGFLWGWLRGEVQRGLDVGVALGALKQSAPGDFPFATLEEAEALVRSSFKGVSR